MAISYNYVYKYIFKLKQNYLLQYELQLKVTSSEWVLSQNNSTIKKRWERACHSAVQ